MIDRYELNKELDSLDRRLKTLNQTINFNELQNQIHLLNNEMLDPSFWSNTNNSSLVTKKLSISQYKIDELKELNSEIDFIKELSLETDLQSFDTSVITNVSSRLQKFETYLLLSGKYDSLNCILELHPGAGGTESQDWAVMLFRMYQRYCERNNFKFEIKDYQNGDPVGLKSATIIISGEYAFGKLQGERGIHRLVRISPFDANSRRHTSFASVEVSPIIENDTNIVILPEDIKIDVYHSSGAGGQSVNTTDSAVRITHLKTKIVVTCQNERSQLQNKEIALEILKGKLLALELEKQQEEKDKIKGEVKSVSWGSQIRSYVFCPYQLVKDHRTQYEENNVDTVMDGFIDNFIDSYLAWKGESNE
jgi:peptide chain release factor 2